MEINVRFVWATVMAFLNLVVLVMWWTSLVAEGQAWALVFVLNLMGVGGVVFLEYHKGQLKK